MKKDIFTPPRKYKNTQEVLFFEKISKKLHFSQTFFQKGIDIQRKL
jgi:hypothetical protein